jgi:hypothetical protein
MASRKRKRGPKPAAPTAPEATPLPPPAATVPGDTSRAARRVAEQRARKAANAAARTADRDATPTGEPAEDPAFFFGFAVPRAKLAFARFWIFGLLAVDAFLQLRHAPRYGAGGFNVGQLGVFDHAAPARVAVGATYIVLAYLFGAFALGVGSRLTVAIAAALYAWLYLASLLDAYQHHYLMALVVGVAIAVPWFRPRDARRAEAAAPVRAWAVRVILIQLGIVYLWAAIAKLDGSWLDGSALRSQLAAGSVRSLIDGTVGFGVAAGFVVVIELVLAVAIWNRRLWPVALPIGVALHVGIAFTNLEIGLFSWLMVALYLLIIPDRWFLAVWRRVSPAARFDRLGDRLARLPAIGGGLVVLGLALPIAIGIPIDSAIPAALGAGIAVIAFDWLRSRGRAPRAGAGLALGAVTILLAVLTATTAVVPDYYRMWGGAMRRLGDRDTARHAYQRAAELAPDRANNHYQLGMLLLEPHDDAEANAARGVAALRRAQALEPRRARAGIALARYLSRVGRRDEALATARAALAAEPGSANARTLVTALERGETERTGPDEPPEADDEAQ